MDILEGKRKDLWVEWHLERLVDMISIDLEGKISEEKIVYKMRSKVSEKYFSFRRNLWIFLVEYTR